jgi:hypothetical protein
VSTRGEPRRPGRRTGEVPRMTPPLTTIRVVGRVRIRSSRGQHRPRAPRCRSSRIVGRGSPTTRREERVNARRHTERRPGPGDAGSFELPHRRGSPDLCHPAVSPVRSPCAHRVLRAARRRRRSAHTASGAFNAANRGEAVATASGPAGEPLLSFEGRGPEAYDSQPRPPITTPSMCLLSVDASSGFIVEMSVLSLASTTAPLLSHPTSFDLRTTT